MPLFVLRIAVDGPAAADGRLRVGDQIVEINGVNTKNMTHADAIDLIKSGGTSVRLLVRRSNSGGKVPPLIGRILWNISLDIYISIKWSGNPINTV